MNHHSEIIQPGGEAESALAELTEQVTRRLESGETVDAEEVAQNHPAQAQSIRALFPLLKNLVKLGRLQPRDSR